jgi:hypothetical protein
MPRKSRIDAPGALQHVIARGINRQPIQIHFMPVGKRPGLVGGGLVRSAGGWSALRGLRREKAYAKGDERILGEGSFVESVLAHVQEAFQSRYELPAQGFDFEKVVERVAEVLGMSREEVLAT